MSRKAKAKSNPAAVANRVASTLDLTPQEIERGLKANREWHWYDDGDDEYTQRVVDWKDPDVPDMLIQIGGLVRMHIRAPEGQSKPHPRRRRDTMIQFSRSVSSGAHIAYDPDHPDERLYLLIPPGQAATLKGRFWDANSFPPMSLNDVALTAGGRHGKCPDYPPVLVKPIGVLTAVVYFTNKKHDGSSYYIHKMAEVSGKFPFLCVDSKGRLWLAGGNYKNPTPGITD